MIDVRILTFAAVTYLWTAPFFDHVEFAEQRDTKVKEILAKYPEVYENPDFRTQAEGVEFMGYNTADVEAAADKLERWLRRQKHIQLRYG